ncbi:MAG: PIN domain-containing protein [archaeon]
MESKSKVIALDSNMLLGISKFKLDVFEESKRLFGEKTMFVVPIQVAGEISRLRKRGKSMERAVNVARELMKKNFVKVRRVKAGNADEALEKMGERGAIIATNDRQLIRKIKEANGSILFIRKKRFVQLK